MDLRRLYEQGVLRYPWLTLVLLSLVGFFLGYQAQVFKLDASSDTLVLENDADLRFYQKIRQNYPSDDYLIVTFTPHSGDVFEAGSLDALTRLVGDLTDLERVDSVQSLLDVPLFRSPPVPLLQLASGYKTLRKEGVDTELAKQEILASPLFSGYLVSGDGKTTALLLEFITDPEYEELYNRRNDLRAKKYEEGLSEEEAGELARVSKTYRRLQTERAVVWRQDVAGVRTVLSGYDGEAKVFLGGLPMIAADMVRFVRNDLVVFGFGVTLFLILTLGLIFRKGRWVLLPMLTCLTAGAFMIGFLGWMDWRATVISSNFTALLFIITMSMAIHLIVRYRELHRDKPEATQRDLVVEAACLVARPCFYCALTTMVGFGSLYFSDIRPVMDFGKMMAMGIGVAYILVFTILPAALLLLPRSQREMTGGKTFGLTEYFAGFAEKRGMVLLCLCVLLAVVSVLGINRLSVENQFINYFKKETEIYQGLAVIDNQLGGTTPIEILIEGEGPDYWFKGENLAKLRQIHEFLDARPESGKVLSLDTLIRVVEVINEGQPVSPFILQMVRRFIPEDMKADVLRPYANEDMSQARMVVRVQESYPELKREVLLNDIDQFLTGEMGLQEDQYKVSGMYVLYNNMLQSLFSSQISTIGAVFLATWLMFTILFRSFYLATIGLVPNVFPVALVLGTLGLLGIPLDMMTITIAAITIGIAVDHTIHYIHRFKEEFPRSGNYLETMHRCHNSIGRAMYFTSITIIAGFSILVLSNFKPTIYFGLFTGLAMTVALLAAMTLLPKLIVILKPLGPEQAP